MPDEPTNWELKRNYEGLRADMRDGFNQINQRLDKMPSSEVFTALLSGLERRVHDVEEDIANDKQDRKADKRLVIGALATGAISILVSIITNLLAARGVG
ncbi:MAG TPA: hypothetical protein VIQ30_14075 [Pseudonocardia sp.]